MIPPSLARLIEKWQAEFELRKDDSAYFVGWGDACSSHASELSAALQSMTAEELEAITRLYQLPELSPSQEAPVAWMLEVDGKLQYWSEKPNDAPWIPLYTHSQPLGGAEAIGEEIALLAESADIDGRYMTGEEVAAIIRQHSQERAGWVMVPREPTEAMLAPNGDKLAYFDFHRKDDAASIYKAMIAAAPTEGK